MGRYEKILNINNSSVLSEGAGRNDEKVRIVVVPEFYDPRHYQLRKKYNDTSLWITLFEKAYSIDPELYERLLVMRCMGTVLVKSKKWGHVMRPCLTLKNTDGWESMDEYDEYKAFFLDGYKDTIVSLLGDLDEDEWCNEWR